MSDWGAMARDQDRVEKLRPRTALEPATAQKSLLGGFSTSGPNPASSQERYEQLDKGRAERDGTPPGTPPLQDQGGILPGMEPCDTGILNEGDGGDKWFSTEWDADAKGGGDVGDPLGPEVSSSTSCGWMEVDRMPEGKDNLDDIWGPDVSSSVPFTWQVASASEEGEDGEHEEDNYEEEEGKRMLEAEGQRGIEDLQHPTHSSSMPCGWTDLKEMALGPEVKNGMEETPLVTSSSSRGWCGRDVRESVSESGIRARGVGDPPELRGSSSSRRWWERDVRESLSESEIRGMGAEDPPELMASSGLRRWWARDVKEISPKKGERYPFTLSAWKQATDADGSIKGFAAILEHVSERGIDLDAKSQMWPYLLGVFDSELCQTEKEIAMKEYRITYDGYVASCQALEAEMMAHSMGDISLPSSISSTPSKERKPSPDDVLGTANSTLSTPKASRTCHGESSTGPSDRTQACGTPSLLVYTQNPFNSLSISELPRELHQFYEVHRIIVTDAIRTDFKKNSLKAAGFASWISAALSESPFRSSRDVWWNGYWLSALTKYELDHATHFSSDQKRQVLRLVNLLSAYAMHDPETGYCQGMSDLALPFLLLMEDDSLAFACFERLMRKVRHNFSIEGTGILNELRSLASLLERLYPSLFDKIRQLGAADCHFAYRMIVVLMRRELAVDKTLRLWEMLWADDMLQHIPAEKLSKCLQEAPVYGTSSPAPTPVGAHTNRLFQTPPWESAWTLGEPHGIESQAHSRPIECATSAGMASPEVGGPALKALGGSPRELVTHPSDPGPSGGCPTRPCSCPTALETLNGSSDQLMAHPSDPGPSYGCHTKTCSTSAAQEAWPTWSMSEEWQRSPRLPETMASSTGGTLKACLYPWLTVSLNIIPDPADNQVLPNEPDTDRLCLNISVPGPCPRSSSVRMPCPGCGSVGASAQTLQLVEAGLAQEPVGPLGDIKKFDKAVVDDNVQEATDKDSYPERLFSYFVAAVVIGQHQHVMGDCEDSNDILKHFKTPRIDVNLCMQQAKQYRAELRECSKVDL